MAIPQITRANVTPKRRREEETEGPDVKNPDTKKYKYALITEVAQPQLEIISVDQEKSVFPLELLASEIVNYMSSFFVLEDLCAFYRASKFCADNSVDGWQEQKKVKHIDFSFKMCANLSQRDQFLFNAVIVKYILQPNQVMNGEYVSKVKKEFSCITRRFPDLDQIVSEDLQRRLYLSPCLFTDSKLNKSIFDTAYAEGNKHGGEALLEGYLHFQSSTIHPSFHMLTKAVYLGATPAALFTVQKWSAAVFNQSKHSLLKIALLAADQRDFRPLEALLDKDKGMAQTLYKSGITYAPVLVVLGKEHFEKREWREGDQYFEDALPKYGREAPGLVLFWAASTKMNRNEYAKADSLYMRALKIVDQSSLKPDLWNEIAVAKSEIKEYAEADKYLEKALLGFGDSIPPYALVNAGIVKARMKDFAVAQSFLKRALSTSTEQDKARACAELAYVKAQLEQFESAASYYKKAFDAYADNVPDKYLHAALKIFLDARNRYGEKDIPQNILIGLARTHMLLNQPDEADKIYDIILPFLSKRAAAKVLPYAAKAKYERRHYKAAEKLYDKLFKLKNVSDPVVQTLAGFTKLLFLQWQSAHKFYSQVLAALGNNASFVTLWNAARVKFRLCLWDEALELFKKVLLYSDCPIACIKEADHFFSYYLEETKNHDAETLELVANTKCRLKQFPSADTLFDQARAAGNNNKDLLHRAAEVKFRLRQYKAAEPLFAEALNAYGKNAPYDLLIYAAHNKHALNEPSQADVLYSKLLEEPHCNKLEAEMIFHIAHIKLQLNQLPEADQLCTLGLEKMHQKEPNKKIEDRPIILSILAQVKFRLNQLDVAETYYEKICTSFCTNPNALIQAERFL